MECKPEFVPEGYEDDTQVAESIIRRRKTRRKTRKEGYKVDEISGSEELYALFEKINESNFLSDNELADD